jgi:hypothetical protein
MKQLDQAITVDARYVTGHTLNVVSHVMSRALKIKWAHSFRTMHYKEALYLIELPQTIVRDKFLGSRDNL